MDHAVNAKSEGPEEGEAGMFAPRQIQTCLACGAKFSATGDRGHDLFIFDKYNWASRTLAMQILSFWCLSVPDRCP
jgi:hypothetical protein